MAFSTIIKPTDYFNTLLYSGNSTARSLTGVGFEPSWVWIKERTSTSDHMLFDQPRGVQKYISSNLTNAEQTSAGMLTAFGSDGFSLGNGNDVNDNGQTYASWNWKANGAGSSNTDGSITSTVSVDTTSKCSIVKFTASGSGGTVGHGLGVAPKAIIFKRLDAASDWAFYHESLGNVNMCFLNTNTAAGSNASILNSTSPTSSVFTVGSSNIVTGGPVIAYCFAEVKGFSKMGSYEGNGDANGIFQYLGFKPSFVLIKNTTANESWFLYDNKRGYNGSMAALFPNEAVADAFANNIDFLSNGFKLKTAGAILNGNTTSYIYTAFAAAPLVGTNNVPATAR